MKVNIKNVLLIIYACFTIFMLIFSLMWASHNITYLYALTPAYLGMGICILGIKDKDDKDNK